MDADKYVGVHLLERRLAVGCLVSWVSQEPSLGGSDDGGVVGAGGEREADIREAHLQSPRVHDVLHVVGSVNLSANCQSFSIVLPLKSGILPVHTPITSCTHFPKLKHSIYLLLL